MKDKILIDLFVAMAKDLNGHTDGGACRYRLHEDSVCYISKRAVYTGPPTDRDNIPVNAVAPYGEGLDTLDIKTPDNALPTKLVSAGWLDIGEAICDMMLDASTVLLPVATVGDEKVEAIWVLKETAQGVYTFLDSVPYGSALDMLKLQLTVTMIPEQIKSVLSKHGVRLAELSPKLSITRTGNILAIILIGDASMLVVPLFALYRTASTLKKIVYDGCEYVGTAWCDTDMVYKNIVKRGSRKMKGLGSPLKVKATAAQEQVVAQVVAQVVSAEMEPATVAPDVENMDGVELIEIVEPEPTEEIVTSTQAPATVSEPEPEPAEEVATSTQAPATVSEPEPEQVQTTPKRQRTSSPKKTVPLDLEKVISMLEAPIDPIKVGEEEALQHELEQLVRLSSAVSTKMASIVCAALDAARVGNERCAAIMDFLNKR